MRSIGQSAGITRYDDKTNPVFLKNKTILIISPQSWGTMFLSKHHYALELARQGNLVYFLNPPETRPSRSGKVRVENSAEHDNLRLIFHSLSFPYDLKFRFTRLFHFLMRRHVRKLLHVVESLPEGMHRPIDIVWSFDLGWLYPFSMFHHSSLKIFHPVDEPLNNTAIRSAEGADILFSVTREILEKW